MFPRNIRKIAPWRIAQIMGVLSQVSRYGDWTGDQALQDRFCTALVAAGLKRDHVPYDPNSGGPRTYYAQLKALGLLYQDRNRSVKFTLAGRDLLEGKPPLPIMQRLLLNLQYPSPYSGGPNVRIHPGLRVKPFVFVFELLREVKFLSVNELQVALVYGHNRHCLADCIRKVKAMKTGAEIRDVVEDLDADLYTPRTAGTKIEAVLAGLRDDANTCKNWLLANCLVIEQRLHGEQVFWENPEYNELIDEAIANADRYVIAGDEMAFQRAFGAWNRKKDTRATGQEDARATLSVDDSIILSKFFEYCGGEIVTHTPEPFVESLRTGFGFSRDKILEVIEPQLGNALNYFNSTYHELAIGGTKTAGKFETATAALLKDRFMFEVQATGQKKRPTGTVGGYSDIFVLTSGRDVCGVLDTKASPAYNLPHGDIAKMVTTYIPTYTELLPEGVESRLGFVAYVAGGFSGDVGTRLNHITAKSSIPASAIAAGALYKAASTWSGKEARRRFVSAMETNIVAERELS